MRSSRSSKARSSSDDGSDTGRPVIPHDAVITDDEVFSAFPTAPIDRDNIEHYRGRMQRRLLVDRCDDCRTYFEPPQAICPNCWGSNVVAVEVSGRGTIHLRTVVHIGAPAPGVDYRAGHPVVVVDLDEQRGLRFSGTVVGCSGDSVTLGARVELVWIEREGPPIPAFRLAEADS